MRNQVSRWHDFVDQALCLCCSRIERLTLNDHHRCILQANQARRPLCAAATGQQAHHDLWHTKLNFRMVNNDAIMACQSQLKPAAQGKSIQRASHWPGRSLAGTQVLGRLTARFHFAQQCVQRKCLVKSFFGAVRLRATQHSQVRAGQETGFLARGNDRAFNGVVVREIINPLPEFFNQRAIPHIHGGVG